MARLQCSAFLATSLDGFIARSDGRVDWLESVQAPGEDYGFHAFFDAVDTLVLGRKTYDLALGFDPWPYAGKRCVVLTHRPPEPRHGETFFAGEPAALVKQLQQAGARRAYVDGGTVVSQFLRAGLLDDLTLSIVPIVLGEGIRLFQPPLPESELVLEYGRAFKSGLAQLRWLIKRPR